jgi:AP-3 complex subunit beta
MYFPEHIFNATIGSLGVITGKSALNDTILPDWLEKGVESSLRDSPDDAPAAPVPLSISSSAVRSKLGGPVILTPNIGSSSPASSSGNGRKWASNLDEFFNEATQLEEGSSEEDEDEEDEEEEGEEEEGKGEMEEEEEEEEDGTENSDSSERDEEERYPQTKEANEKGYQAFE